MIKYLYKFGITYTCLLLYMTLVYSLINFFFFSTSFFVVVILFCHENYTGLEVIGQHTFRAFTTFFFVTSTVLFFPYRTFKFCFCLHSHVTLGNYTVLSKKTSARNGKAPSLTTTSGYFSISPCFVNTISISSVQWMEAMRFSTNVFPGGIRDEGESWWYGGVIFFLCSLPVNLTLVE